MVKATFHEKVDYSFLTDNEKKSKAAVELYTIFYLHGHNGLTDFEVYEWTQKFGFSGYSGFTPTEIVRNNIYKWNDTAISVVTNGKKCESEQPCKKICSWGYTHNIPHRCERHKLDGMYKVVEERLVKIKKKPGETKGKFYFDETFGKRVLKNNNFSPHEPEFPESSDTSITTTCIMPIPISMEKPLIKEETQIPIITIPLGSSPTPYYNYLDNEKQRLQNIRIQQNKQMYNLLKGCSPMTSITGWQWMVPPVMNMTSFPNPNTSLLGTSPSNTSHILQHYSQDSQHVTKVKKEDVAMDWLSDTKDDDVHVHDVVNTIHDTKMDVDMNEMFDNHLFGNQFFKFDDFDP
jgi:hypothetical protein